MKTVDEATNNFKNSSFLRSRMKLQTSPHEFFREVIERYGSENVILNDLEARDDLERKVITLDSLFIKNEDEEITLEEFTWKHGRVWDYLYDVFGKCSFQLGVRSSSTRVGKNLSCNGECLYFRVYGIRGAKNGQRSWIEPSNDGKEELV